MVDRFGPFEILRSLGAGGMAETFLAIRRGEAGVERKVALKRILGAYGRDRDFVRSFVDEARLAVRLEHPNVCRLYDFGQIDGTYWMSLELCEGGDLRDLLDGLEAMRQPMPLDLVVLLALDMAQALHYAHNLEIDGRRVDLVHRDISPSNVLIDGHGHFKLADFGIARALTNVQVTASGVVKGKTQYMSPDHVQAHKVDGRDDLWSLGVMLFECVAGARPFTGPTEMSVMMNIMKGERPRLLDLAPSTPPQLAAVIERLLAHDRSQRTPDAAALMEDLEPLAPAPSARLRLSKLVPTARAAAAARAAMTSAETDPAAAGVRAASDASRTDESPVAAPTEAELAPPSYASPSLATRTPLTASDLREPGAAPRRPALLAGAGVAVGLVVALGGGMAILSWVSPTPPSTAVTAAPPPSETRALAAPPPSSPPPPTGADAPPSTIAAVETEQQGTPVGEDPPASDVDAGVTATAEATETTETTETTGAAGEAGTLDVTAIPWGGIWIDGRRVGEGHVVRHLSAGTHRVAVGNERPGAPREVEIAPGGRSRISLRVAHGSP